MNTHITPLWIARDFAREWVNADPYGRLPHPFRVVFGESGHECQIKDARRPASAPATLYLFDCQWTPESDIDALRERVIRPLVRHSLKDRGEWRSAFRTMLIRAWAADPWPHRDVLGAA